MAPLIHGSGHKHLAMVVEPTLLRGELFKIHGLEMHERERVWKDLPFTLDERGWTSRAKSRPLRGLFLAHAIAGILSRCSELIFIEQFCVSTTPRCGGVLKREHQPSLAMRVCSSRCMHHRSSEPNIAMLAQVTFHLQLLSVGALPHDCDRCPVGKNKAKDLAR